MSATVATGGMAGPWKKIAIWAAVFVAIVVVLFMFTGHLTFHKEQPKPTYKVQMNTQVSALERPAQPPPATVQTATLPPAAAPASPLRLPIAQSNERQKAYDSDIGAYVMSRNGDTAARPAGAGKPAADPDAIPPSGQPDALEASLVPTKMEGTRVAELPNPRYLVEQGRQLPCTQQTKINSSLPGSVTAIIPVEIRGETGDTVLIPKGARVFGTVQHGLMNGLDRLAVLWQNITTPVIYDRQGMPRQFRVAVNSPAASELGETGLDGDIDRHLAKKLGGIIGMSLIQGGIQAGVSAAQNSGNGNQTFNFNQFQQGGNSAADMLLRSWISIPDVMTRDQGLTCSIQLVRDLDLRGAYKLIQSIRSAS